jgi:hypothetical protein
MYTLRYMHAKALAFPNSPYRLLEAAHALHQKALCAVVFGCFLLCAPTWLAQIPSHLKGPWADQALSEVLSERYGANVTVHNVRFQGWRHVYFDAIRVESKQGRPLVRASKGSLHLRDMDLWKKMAFETEVHLEGLAFMKDYYKNTRSAQGWGKMMHRPLEVDELRLRVVQDKTQTVVAVTDCRSNGIKIDGGLRLNKNGGREDHLRISVSAWQAIRSMV